MSQKLYNPKSNAPAIYIPCWLIQVSIKLLSHGAKITYGRLSQWSSSSGKAYRSVPQLAEELGCSNRSVEEYLRELRNVKLIGTYQPQAGGINHFEFYDHPWMYDAINDHLVYKQDKYTPPHHSVVPTTPECGTPPHDSVDINIKEIKEIKDVGADAAHTQIPRKKTQKETAEKKALEATEITELFESKFSGLDITLENLFKSCQEHYEQKSLWTTRDRFLKWVTNENPDNYKKITVKRDPSIPTVLDFQEYNAKVRGYEWVGDWIRKQEAK